MSEKLLPCPFCGVEPEISAAFSTRTKTIFVHPDIPGQPCFAAGRVISHGLESAAAWNRRAPAAPATPARDDLRAACEKLGFWMSGALEDPNTSDEMKRDINEWFAALRDAGGTDGAS